MDHFPIVDTDNRSHMLEFSHFDHDARAGQWSKDYIIMHDHVKINVFMEGRFSLYLDGVLRAPAYGDICFIAPMKMHYGQIKEATHLNYYEFDIGLDAFASLPDGEGILRRIVSLTKNGGAYIRPDQKSRDAALILCDQIHAAVQKEELCLAYAKVIELLCLLYRLYSVPAKTEGVAFSLRTSQIIRFIENNYSDDVSVQRMSEAFDLSASFLCRIFKRELGITIHEYVNQYRVLKALQLLKGHSVTETAYLCGFCDTSHFISVFKKAMNITPMQYKSSHAQSDRS